MVNVEAVTRLIKMNRASLLWLVLFAFVLAGTDADAGQPKKKRKKSRRARVERVTSIDVVTERSVAEGIRYAMYTTNGRTPVRVHVVTMDRTTAGIATRVVKGEELVNGREALVKMSSRYSTESGNAVLALVNANFWAAVRNTPIGPCVIDGEVVEMNPYKHWSSAFFTVQNQVMIDTFRITGSLSWKGAWYSIGNVNRRMDSLTAVVYNTYAGTTIPFVSTKQIERAFSDAIKDSVFLDKDSTEIALSQEMLRTEIQTAQRESSIEHPMVKIRVRYLRTPSLNRPWPCKVLDIDSGTVDMPLRGAVISLPRSIIYSELPSPGDTVMVSYKTNLYPNERFMNAVSGTPRLVRNGNAKHEALKEGSTGKRFIRHNLARTALGTNKSGNRLMLVAIEPQNGKGNKGATLDDMAKIMQLLGAHQAMNLDGGGSTGMVVEGDHVFFDGMDPDTRPVSVGLAVVRLSHILRTSLQYNK